LGTIVIHGFVLHTIIMTMRRNLQLHVRRNALVVEWPAALIQEALPSRQTRPVG